MLGQSRLDAGQRRNRTKLSDVSTTRGDDSPEGTDATGGPHPRHDEIMFSDRAEAGKALGSELAKMDLHDPVVLALPRGGVPVAAANSRVDSGVVRRGRTTWVSGSPNRALNSMTRTPVAVRMRPQYSSPMNGVPSAASWRIVG